MDIETLLKTSTANVAAWVRSHGPQVCVFPINGTRRWFILECDVQPGEDLADAYVREVGRRQIELYRMFFEHGVDTLLTPIFGPDILERGEGYRQVIAHGLAWCATDSDVLRFYDEYDVRVRIYGDARHYLQNTPYTDTLDAFDDVAQRTASHRSHRLFFGVCAHDAAETIAEIGARFYHEHGRLPTRREIVEAYYGEYVEPAGFFIGFDRFAAFDFPLLDTGNVDLYFTVAPSPYLDQETLRRILYDHLVTRRGEPQHGELTAADWDDLGRFYRLNRTTVLGIGTRTARGGLWLPIGGVWGEDGLTRLRLV